LKWSTCLAPAKKKHYFDYFFYKKKKRGEEEEEEEDYSCLIKVFELLFLKKKVSNCGLRSGNGWLLIVKFT
jgi:hypothetical protein